MKMDLSEKYIELLPAINGSQWELYGTFSSWTEL